MWNSISNSFVEVAAFWQSRRFWNQSGVDQRPRHRDGIRRVINTEQCSNIHWDISWICFLIKLSISTEFFLSTDRWNRVHSELICVKYQNYCHKYLEFVKCYKSLESFKSVPHRLEHSGDISTVLNPHFYWFWIEFFDFYRMTGWSYLCLNFTCGNQF